MRIIYILIVVALLVLSLIGNEVFSSNSSISFAESQLAQATLPSQPWQDVDTTTRLNTSALQQEPRVRRSLKLNVEMLQTILRRAPQESLSSNKTETITLDLPAPDAGFMRFNIEDSPIMEKALADRYPEIKTYRGQGIDDPTAITRFDWTPSGFHAIILSTRGTIFIEPVSRGDVVNYVAYFQDHLPGTFQCEVDTATQQEAIEEQEHLRQFSGVRASVSSGSALRTYRLAVAATAEYTQAYGNGTVAGALSAITTTMNLVNGIYERELAIRMVLIANEDSIIFTDTNTDGYTSDSVSSLISQNQSKLDTVIGPANYDIGHVFDGRITPGFFSWQGQASLGAVCRNSVKGRGVTITRNVQPSEIFAIYIVAHEMGHQFGASHTFNATTGTCGPERSPSTAYEPGTGSTIMGYRLACGAEDLGSSDTYFHVASLEQITNYTTVGLGSCATSQPTGNSIPTVDAGASYNIPSQTPFQLTATASDPNADNLTYSWEQFDVGAASPPNTDDGTRPIFRSFAPSTNPTRTFPRLQNILSLAMPLGESLPTTTRTLNFRVTVRDNRSSGGAVNSDSMQLNVSSAAGPFTVTQPVHSTVWARSSSQTVTWNVANTASAPVSCTNVKISLSIDGGATFPFILANSTPNDGSETITVPGFPGSNNRVKVEAIGNVFFNISAPFVISGTATSVFFSGRVIDGLENPISGATITFTKNFQGTITTTSVSTDAQGFYASGDLGCQNSVQVTPSKVGFSFNPLSSSFVSTGCLTGAQTANFTGTATPPTIFVEEGTNQLAAVDSVTLVRGPFELPNNHNFSIDQRTRIIFFTTDLGFNPTIQPDLNTLSVQINGSSFPVEAVGPSSTTSGSYIVFRLPDLPAGTYPLSIRVRGVNSTNSPNLTIIAFVLF
jgi:Metallo-peptidase family M12B Reprolysin-like